MHRILLGVGPAQRLDVPPQLVHLLLADLLHLFLQLELVVLHFKLQVDFVQSRVQLVDFDLQAFFTALALLDLLLQVNHNHGRAYDVVVNDDPRLLALELLPQVFNGFVLLADQVVFAFVA